MPIPPAVRAAAAAALLVVIGGCGRPAEGPTVASAGGTPTAVASTDAVTAYVEGVRQFVACLRAKGVEVSDPDAKGRYTFSGDARALKSDPGFLAAQLACNDLNPPLPEGIEDKPPLTAEQIEVRRHYARCMQDNGVPQFPDPGPDGYQPDSNDGESPWDPTTTSARRATATCASIIGDPADPSAGKG